MVLNLLMRSILSSRQSSLASPIPAMARKILPIQIDDDLSKSSLVNYMQTRGAARKYKRLERMRKLKAIRLKKKITGETKPKKTFQKAIKIDKGLFRFVSERDRDQTLPPPPADDVYFCEKFRKPRYSLEEILEFHRQFAHPDVMNQPESLVTATIELNLKMKIKKKKFIEKIDSTLGLPYPFAYQLRPRKIVALCKEEADQNAAREAGAIMAGSVDIAQMLKSKQLTARDFDHIVCHTDFLVELAAVKGLKGQPYFPSKQRANYGNDIVELVKKFKEGIDYSLKPNEHDPSFGSIECHFGKLNMPNDQLRANLVALFDSVSRFKPINLADNKQFFQRVAITIPTSEEMFILKFWNYTDDYVDPDTIVDEDAERAQVAS